MCAAETTIRAMHLHALTAEDRRRAAHAVRAFGDVVLQARHESPWGIAEGVAEVARDALGFEVVALNRFRPTWEDYRVDVVVGSASARDHLLGTTAPRQAWATEVLRADARIAPGQYFLRGDGPDWNHGGAVWQSGDERPAAARRRDAWQPEDTLLLELVGRGGAALAVLSFDEPIEGRRPGTREALLLALARRHLGIALQVAEVTDRTAARRGQLAAVEPSCRRLAEASAARAVYRELCECVTGSMGFGRAALYRRAGTAHLELAAVGGRWPALARGVADRPVPFERARRLLGSAGMLLGGILAASDAWWEPATRAEARALVGDQPRSVNPRLWRDDVLLMPMRTPTGRLDGVLALAAPEDQLLPRAALRHSVAAVVECAQHALEALPPADGRTARVA